MASAGPHEARRRRLARGIPALVLCLALTGGAVGGAQAAGAGTAGVQKVLVIPIKYKPPYCPDASAACQPKGWLDSLQKNGQPYTRNTADQLQAVLTAKINAFYAKWTYGNVSFKFRVLKNPATADGWWWSPSSVQQIVASYLATLDGFTGSPSTGRDAVEGVLKDALEAGVIGSNELGQYPHVLTVQNFHVRAGQANDQGAPVSYSITFKPPGPPFGHITEIRSFTVANVFEDASDDALASIVSHELGHTLGLPDLYGDCAGIYPNPQCMGHWDVMAWDWVGPNHFGGWSKVKLGVLPLQAPRVLTLGPPSGSEVVKTVMLAPLEVGSQGQTQVIRLPFTTGPQFNGYYVECRKKLNGDEKVPKTGVLITAVDEGAPAGMQVWAVRTENPADIATAPLGLGKSFLDAKRGILVKYETLSTGCGVRVEYSPKPKQPDPAIWPSKEKYYYADYTDFESPDIWVDSPANGYYWYPKDQQVIDVAGEPVPLGPGDPPWAGQTNRIGVRIRNLGNISATNVTVEVSVRQPLTVDTLCGPKAGPKQVLETFTIPVLSNLKDTVRYVDWVPKSDAPARIEVRILPVKDELSLSNNYAQESVAFEYVEESIVTLVSTKLNGRGLCAEKLIVAPVFVPKGWTARVTPVDLRVTRGVTRAVEASVRAPRSARAGTVAEIPVVVYQAERSRPRLGSVRRGPGDAPQYEILGGVKIIVSVGRRTSLTCSAAAGEVGSALVVSGAVRPAQQDDRLALVYVSPSGRRSVRAVPTGSDGTYRDALVPTEAGDWRVSAHWQGDRDSLPADSRVCPFAVGPGAPVIAPSSVSCGVSPGVAAAGTEVTVSGALAPAHPGATVTVEYRSPTGATTTRQRASDAAGAYRDSFSPGEPGSWTVRIDWGGDADHRGSEATCTFRVEASAPALAPSSISCDASPAAVPRGESVTISGTIAPPHAGATVTVEYTSPAGAVASREAVADSSGAFRDGFSPGDPGAWTVRVRWPGDADHQGVEAACAFSYAV